MPQPPAPRPNDTYARLEKDDRKVPSLARIGDVYLAAWIGDKSISIRIRLLFVQGLHCEFSKTKIYGRLVGDDQNKLICGHPFGYLDA